MKTVLALVVSLFVVGCATNAPMYNGVPQELRITWHKAKDKNEVVRICMSEYPGLLKSDVTPNGCFWRRGDSCHVVSIDEQSYLRTLGHEIKHCFDGLWHDHEGKPMPGSFLVEKL